MRIVSSVALLLLLISCAAPLPCNHPITTSGERVICVIDGDTVRLDDGKSVRFIGIDTPERGKTGYDEATSRTIELLNGTTIRFEKDVSDTDRYDRLLRFVYADDVFVNEVLVEEGFAKAFPYEPDTSRADVFKKAQDEAKQGKTGLWK